jgi:hypothetical protein
MSVEILHVLSKLTVYVFMTKHIKFKYLQPYDWSKCEKKTILVD